MATEIQRILIKYESDVKAVVDGANKVIDANEGIVDSEKDVAREGKKAFKEVQTEIKNTEAPLKGLGGSIKAVGAAIAAAFSVREIIEFAKESVKLADIQLRAEAQLLQGLQGREDIQQRLIKSAAEIQKRTIFGDEAIIQQQAFLASLGFSEQKIKDVIAASVDLSAATGLTLEGSVRNLAKTYSGLSGELGELIPQLRGLTVEQLKNGEGVRVATELFKGQAEIIAQTGTGPIIQLQNAFADLQEEIGKVIIESMPEFTEQLRRGVSGATDFVKQLTGVEERTGAVGAAADTADKAITALRKSFELLTEPMNQVVALFRDMSIEIPGTGREINLFSTYIKGLGIVIEQLVTNRIEDGIKALQFLGAGIAGVRAALVPGGKTFIEAFNESLAQSRGLIGEQGEKLGDEFGNSFDIGYKQALESGMSAEDALAAVLASEKARKEAEKAGKAVGTAIVKGASDKIKEDGTKEIILELQKQLNLIEFRLKFGVDPEGVDLINDGIIPVKTIQASGTALDELGKKIQDYGEIRERQSERLLNSLDDEQAKELAKNQTILDSIQTIISAYGTLGIAIDENSNLSRIATLAQLQFSAATAVAKQSEALAAGVASAAAVPFPGNIPAILSVVAAISAIFAQVASLGAQAKALTTGFAVGTSDAPGGTAWVGEKGPEIMHVPKGARVFTAEASKKERSLIDALNAGKHEEFIHDHYLKPFAAQLAQGNEGWSYDDFQLRQTIRGNKVVKIHPESLRQMKGQNITRYR